jgi:hypothetical protein
MLGRREVPTLPPRMSLTSLVDSDQASVPPTAHTLGRGPFESTGQPLLSDASESDFETGAPVSRTRGAVLPTLGELSPLQRKLALVTGVAALGLIGFGIAMVLGGRSELGPHAAGDGSDAPVAEPAAPPTPVVAPRLAEAPPSPLPAVSSSAAPPDRELDEEQKKKDKKRRLGPAAPAAPAGNPDYGI